MKRSPERKIQPTSSSKSALSRIEAAANIQIFLLDRQFITASSVSSVNQNDAIVKDVLRLAEYIGNQCKILRQKDTIFKDQEEDSNISTVNHRRKKSASNSLNEKKILMNESIDVKNITELNCQKKGNVSFPLPTITESNITEIKNTTETSEGPKNVDKNEQVFKQEESVSERKDALSTPIKEVKDADSDGFDRLLTKMFSPCKSSASSPNLATTTRLSKSNTIEEDADKTEIDGNALDSSLYLTLSLNLPSADNIRSEYTDDTHYYDNINDTDQNGIESEQGMVYNDMSSVVKNDDESDDDDDDVFDLLRSVDDWSALRNFIRVEKVTEKTELISDMIKSDINTLAVGKEQVDHTLEETKDGDINQLLSDHSLESNVLLEHPTETTSPTVTTSTSHEKLLVSLIASSVDITIEESLKKVFMNNINSGSNLISKDDTKNDGQNATYKSSERTNSNESNPKNEINPSDQVQKDHTSPDKSPKTRMFDFKTSPTGWGVVNSNSSPTLKNHINLRKSWALAIQRKEESPKNKFD